MNHSIVHFHHLYDVLGGYPALNKVQQTRWSSVDRCVFFVEEP